MRPSSIKICHEEIEYSGFFRKILLKKTKPTIINNSDFNISDQNGWICGMVVNFDRPEQLPVPVIVHSEFLRT